MFRNIKNIDFSRMEDALPSFFTIVLIPLTYSITEGIVWGIICHVLAYSLSGRLRKIPIGMWILFGFSVFTVFS
jgi:AGZA family xanthine/uracil permease-like MFS transporter